MRGGEAAAVGLQDELPDQVPGRLGDEGDAVPVFLRKASGGVERAAGAGGVAAEIIDLPHLVGDGEELRACRRSLAVPLRGQALGLFVVAIRDRQVETGIAIGG